MGGRKVSRRDEAGLYELLSLSLERLLEPLTEGMTKEEAEEFGAVVGEWMGVGLSVVEATPGVYVVQLLDVLNTLLARRDMTLAVTYEAGALSSAVVMTGCRHGWAHHGDRVSTRLLQERAEEEGE